MKNPKKPKFFCLFSKTESLWILFLILFPACSHAQSKLEKEFMSEKSTAEIHEDERRTKADLPRIVQVDHRTLREDAEAVPVEEISSPKIQTLIETMVQVMRQAPGVGLAAPQIGVPLQVIVLEDRQEYFEKRLNDSAVTERNRYAFPLKVIINPKLTFLSEKKVKFIEGCLSVEGYMAEVARSVEVEVEGLDEKAQPFQWRVSGWPARILQHEIDHLNSTLYFDRMDRKTFQQLPDPHRETGPLAILPLGHPALRDRAHEILPSEIRSSEIQAMIREMVKTMRAQSLVGLGANQIGILKRIIVIEDKKEYQQGVSEAERQLRLRKPVALRVILNPKLTLLSSSPSSVSFFEGSPCIPGYQGKVERALRVKVQGLDGKGRPLVWETEGWPARILQHEVDHLDGIVYTDRMDSKTFQSFLSLGQSFQDN